MTNSCSSNSARDEKLNFTTTGWLRPLLLAATCALLAGPACGSDEPERSCDDDETPQVPGAPADALILSQFKLESRMELATDGTKKKLPNIASAIFVDVSHVDRINRSPNDQKFSMTCSGLTGAPSDQCRPPHTEDCVQVKLMVDKIEVSGVPGGLNLESKGTGTFVDTDPPEPLYGDGEVTIKVTGKQGDPTYFPSYEQSLAPPKALELTDPAPGAKAGARDLKVCWNGGDGNLVEIGIQVERANPDPEKPDTDKVVCLVRDDGCHTVPVSAFDWLRLGDLAPDDAFKLTVIRQKLAVDAKGTTASEIKASYRIEMVLGQDA